MATFAEALRSGVKSAFCQVISTTDRATALIRRQVSGDAFDDLSFPGLLNRYVCDRDMPTEPPPPPFTGGQCCDAAYQVSWTYSARNTVTGTLRGPFTGGSLLGFGKIVSYDIREPRSNLVFILQTCDGVSREEPKGELVLEEEIAEGFSLTVVGAHDGNTSGDCGDPVPTVGDLPPGWNQGGGDITYTNNQGNNVTVPIVAAFGYASINVDADVTIPVTVDVGGINFDLDFNLNTGDIKLFPTDNIYGDRRPGTKPTDVLPPPGEDTPDYPPNLPPGLPPIGEGESEGESAIVAVLVTVTEFDNELVGTLFQSDNPDISIPNFGYVSFLCRVGTIDSAWSSDIPVKNRRNVIPCPLPWGAIQVKGTSRQGVSWVLTPLYSKKEAPVVFPA